MRSSDSVSSPLPDGHGLRVAIVTARFNHAITARLFEGARAALLEAGVAEDAVESYDVPGAFELPFAARAVALARRIDAVVCLGCVIRGDTPHFEYVSSAAANGLMAAQVATGVPMAFGVLTTNSVDEAEVRAAPGPGNKGREAAAAALDMARFGRRLSATRTPVGLRA